MKEKILLTGGLGFFGSRFTKKYMMSYDILSLGKDDLDITDEDNVIKTFKEFKPRYVIHTAAIASTDFCNNHPKVAYDINVAGAVNVAKACKAVGARMVFISTEQVFNGNIERGPYREEDIPKPNTVYGENKLEAEGLLKEIIDELWILRFTWLFGLPERNCKINPNILWNTLQIALKGKNTRVTCNEYRGLTYVHEVIDQFYKIFDIPYGTYHIGNHNDLSRYDVTCLILKELGLESRIDELIEKDMEKYKEHPRDIRLCTDKIKKYGINFSGIRDSIKKCLDEFDFRL